MTAYFHIVALMLLSRARRWPGPVLLGTAKNFAILTKTGVSTVPGSAVSRPLPDFVDLKVVSLEARFLSRTLQVDDWSDYSHEYYIAGGASDTWIFQISTTLVQAANVHINWLAGPFAERIWVVAGTVSVGAGAMAAALAQTELALGMATGYVPERPFRSLYHELRPCFTVAFADLDASIEADGYSALLSPTLSKNVSAAAVENAHL
ncbi:hypothetical protein B0H13DRAFT_2361717 [Mycena leptocephala]|nr:hypothetical protein B0H13DRAFT_2361717 [Mycena leptocephala]